MKSATQTVCSKRKRLTWQGQSIKNNKTLEENGCIFSIASAVPKVTITLAHGLKLLKEVVVEILAIHYFKTRKHLTTCWRLLFNLLFCTGGVRTALWGLISGWLLASEVARRAEWGCSTALGDRLNVLPSFSFFLGVPTHEHKSASTKQIRHLSMTFRRTQGSERRPHMTHFFPPTGSDSHNFFVQSHWVLIVGVNHVSADDNKPRRCSEINLKFWIQPQVPDTLIQKRVLLFSA